MEVAAIRRVGGRCYALTRTGRFKRRTGADACRPARFFAAAGSAIWSYRLERRFPRGRFTIYSRAVAADGTVEATPDKVRIRVRR